MDSSIINGTAVSQSSLGARRYYEAVRANSSGRVKSKSVRPGPARVCRESGEMLDPGRRDAIYWSPCHRGPLLAHNHVVTVLDCINIEHVIATNPAGRRCCGPCSAGYSITPGKSCAYRTLHTGRSATQFCGQTAKLHVFAGPIAVSVAVPADPAAIEAENPGDFVLMIANLLPHKNTRRAVESFASSTAARRGYCSSRRRVGRSGGPVRSGGIENHNRTAPECSRRRAARLAVAGAFSMDPPQPLTKD